MSKILVAPNSFKECADSVKLSELISENLAILPNVKLTKKPISDGGDGFLNVCKFHFGGKLIHYQISTAYDDSLMKCSVLYVEKSKTIFIESAEILGLKVIPKNLRKPQALSSKGIGDLLLKIGDDVKTGKIFVDRIYLGVGGTATIDMGLGMMGSLGLKLLDKDTNVLPVLPINNNKVKAIKWNKINLPFEILPIADVANQLTGEEGGVMVYGKQKGATKEELVKIETGFGNILNLLKNNQLIKSLEFLSGAGGGIAASFQIFFNSYCESSYEFILNDLKLADHFSNFDYLITGEGAFDRQTLFGKGAGLLMLYYVNKVKKIFLVCGQVDEEIKAFLPQNVEIIELISFFENKEKSIRNYNLGIKKACEKIAKQIQF